MEPVLAAQLARDLDRTLVALAHGEHLVAGIDQAAAAIALQDTPRYSPLRTLLATAAASTDRVQQALRDIAADQAESPIGCRSPDRSPGDDDPPAPSPGLPPTTGP
jgi:hypothetical protein